MNEYIYIYIYAHTIHIYAQTLYICIVTWHKIFILRREFIFRTCEVGAVWYLIPRRISPS